MNMVTRIQPDIRTVSDNPTREEAETAFRTIIRWAGDDPDRDGLAKTPARLARATRSISPATRSTPRICSRRPSRKRTAMTK